MASVDPDDKFPAIPEQRTIFLVNTYILHTVQLLNKFSSICEQKIAEVHRRILKLDATVTLLEAKLNSVEESESQAEPSSPAHVSAISEASPERTEMRLSVVVPGSVSEAFQQEAAVGSPSTSSTASERPSRPKVKDDPVYSRFFRMLQVGVPERAVKLQMSVEGFQTNLLDNPEAPVPV